MRLGAKPAVFLSEAAQATLDHLSKTALMDLCWDMLRRMEGLDEPEERLLAKLDCVYLPPVRMARGEKPIRLSALYRLPAGA